MTPKGDQALYQQTRRSAQEAAAPTGGAAEVAGEAAWSATRAGGSRL